MLGENGRHVEKKQKKRGEKITRFNEKQRYRGTDTELGKGRLSLSRGNEDELVKWHQDRGGQREINGGLGGGLGYGN